MNTNDFSSVDSIVRALYECVSYRPPQVPDWEGLRSLFAPHARMIPTQRANPDAQIPLEWTVEDYIARYQKGIAAGNPSTGFHESELARRSESFANIVHVWSTYESRHLAEDSEPFVRGINSLQLMKYNGRWWVVSLLWDDEHGGEKIPSKYLPE